MRQAGCLETEGNEYLNFIHKMEKIDTEFPSYIQPQNVQVP